MRSGFINVLKPPGMTSHDVVGFVRYHLHEKQVGHAGTLDPGAAGVLPIAVGKATRLIEYLSNADKAYRAEITLGFSTDSGDDQGKITDEYRTFVMSTEEKIKLVLNSFLGKITQLPPAHSAIKINGKRACDLLRKGIKVNIPARKVNIYNIRLVGAVDRRAEGGDATLLLDVECSKGTYIRSLCTDIGQALEIPAMMSFLVRTRVGDFALENSFTLEEILQMLEDNDFSFLNVPEKYLSHIPSYQLNPKREKAFCNGLPTTDWVYAGESEFLLVYSGDRFLGIGRYEKETQNIIPTKVIYG